MSKSSYSVEGDYHLTRCVLTAGKLEIDLSGMFIDIAIYENMFDQVISGDISVADAHGLEDRTPLYGNEIIDIEFYTAGNEESPIHISGLVYKIDSSQMISGSSAGYIIRFADEFMIRSSKMAYRYGHQTEISNMVSMIYHNTMKNSTTEAKPLHITPTAGIEHYVGNKISPMAVISRLSDKAVSKNNEYGYMFYQDNRGFNFRPLEELYKQEPVTEFINRDAGIFKDAKQHTVERFNAIQNIEFAESNNSYVERIARGSHGSRWYGLDLLSKQITVVDQHREKSFDSGRSLGSVPHMLNEIESSVDGLHVLNVGVGENIQTKSSNILSRENIFTFRAMITTNGDSSLKVGDVVLVNLPQWNTARGEVSKPKAGRFLMTEIKHVLNKRSYIQLITIQKDGYDVEVSQ